MTTSRNSDNHAEQWLQTRPGERCLIRVPGDTTGGAYALVEIISTPGDGTPVHVHQNEDEHFVVLEGAARILIGEEIVDLGVGQSITLPRGVKHAWANVSDRPLRFLGTVVPSGCEKALEIIAKGGEINLIELAATYGVTVIAPPPF